MEKNLEASLFSKKAKEKTHRKKELVKLICLLLFSNSVTYLLSLDGSTQTNTRQVLLLPKDYLKIKLEAKLLIPFESGKEVKVLDNNNHLICEKIILESLIELSNDESFLEEKKSEGLIAYSPSKCLQSLLSNKKLKIVPTNYNSLKIAQRTAYEVKY